MHRPCHSDVFPTKTRERESAWVPLGKTSNGGRQVRNREREIERLEEMGGRKRGEGRETSPMLLTLSLSLTGLRPKLFEDSRPGNDYCLPTLTGLVALVTLTAGLRAVITRLPGRGSSRPREFQPTTLTQTHARTKEAQGLGRGHENTSTHRNPPDRLTQR